MRSSRSPLHYGAERQGGGTNGVMAGAALAAGGSAAVVDAQAAVPILAATEVVGALHAAALLAAPLGVRGRRGEGEDDSRAESEGPGAHHLLPFSYWLVDQVLVVCLCGWSKHVIPTLYKRSELLVTVQFDVAPLAMQLRAYTCFTRCQRSQPDHLIEEIVNVCDVILMPDPFLIDVALHCT